jgi:hypothetical protein
LVIGSIGSNRTCLKNIQQIKNIEIGRYGQYQKIISANSASFQEKKPFWRCSGKILQPMKSTKKIQRENVIHL